MWKDLLDVVKDVAPIVAGAAGTAAGGPALGGALAAIARRISGKGGEASLNDVAAEIMADPNKLMEFRLETQRIEADLKKASMAADAEGARILNARVDAYEGTATDLKGMPFFGPLVLFLRGCQRPAWGFATMGMDWEWFTVWGDLTSKQEAALVIINLLVLGFLFGERAVQNVAPLIADVLRAKVGR